MLCKNLTVVCLLDEGKDSECVFLSFPKLTSVLYNCSHFTFPVKTNSSNYIYLSLEWRRDLDYRKDILANSRL